MRKHLLIGSVAVCVSCGVAAERPAPRAGPAAPVSRPPAKKGICLNTGRQNTDRWKARVAALNVSWHYSWGAQLPEAEPKGVEFVPMLWGYRGAGEKFLRGIERLTAAAAEQTRTHLLGFNEPDGKDQANLSVDRALEAWPYLVQTGLRLGSPAPVHADGEWMRAFMAQAKGRNYRVDFVCVHAYYGPNAAALVSRLKKIHALYGKPIWITEFAVADWKAKRREENRYTPDTVLRFMREVLPMLDRLDFVERYAWFPARENSRALGPSALFREDGSLTPLGQFYAAYGTDASKGNDPQAP